MIERHQDLCFAGKPRQPIGIVHERLGQDLQGDVALQLRVVRAIDLSHAALTDEGRHAVGTNQRSWHQAGGVADHGGRRDIDRLIDQHVPLLTRKQRLDLAA